MDLVTKDGRNFPICAGVNTIGRGPDNMVVLPTLSVSRQHAQIRWDNSGVYIQDVGSVNGTRVNGRLLPPALWQPLLPGDQLQLGTDLLCQVVAVAPVPLAVMAPTMAQAGPMALASPPFPLPVAAGSAAPVALDPGLPASRTRNVVDMLLQAIDVSLDRHKLVLAVAGIIVAGLAFLAALFIASKIGGQGLFLIPLFILFGAIVAWLALSLTLGAVTRMSYAELNHQSRVPMGEAINYAVRRWPEFAVAPLALFALLLVTGLAEIVVMLVGRIPYLGELLVSVLFVPAVVLNLFLVLLYLFGSSLIAPIIVDRGRGIGGTVSLVLRLMRRAPGRIAAYLGLALVLTLFATTILWYMVFLALTGTFQAVTVGLGSKFIGIVSTGVLSGLGIPGTGLPALNSLLGGSGLDFLGRNGVPFTYGLAGWLLLFGLFVTLALTVAYPVVLQATMTCAVYLQVKDDVPTED